MDNVNNCKGNAKVKLNKIYIYIYTRMINYKILRISSFGKDMKELHVSYMVDKSTKLCDHLKKTVYFS